MTWRYFESNWTNERICVLATLIWDVTSFISVTHGKWMKFTSNTAGVYRTEVWDCGYYCNSAVTCPGVQVHVSASMPPSSSVFSLTLTLCAGNSTHTILTHTHTTHTRTPHTQLHHKDTLTQQTPHTHTHIYHTHIHHTHNTHTPHK